MELFKLFGTIAIHNDEANQAIDDTVGKAKDSESSLSSTFKKVGTAVAAAFSAQKIIDFGVQSVNTLQGFEDSMLKVQSLSGATADQYQQLSDAALHYGSTTAWTSQNVADAMGYMALAGFDTNEILSATPGVLSLASASGEDLATVSDILTDAMTGFGDSASDATRYADVLATTQAKSNTTVGMLGEAFTYVSSLAGTYSYSLEDVSTALGVMANGWIFKTMTWDAVNNPKILMSKGKKYLTDTQFENVTIEAKAIDLHLTDAEIEQFKLGDSVRVLSSPHGLDRYFPLTKMTVNLDKPANNTVTLGITEKKSLTAVSSTINDKTNNATNNILNKSAILKEAQDQATALITAATHGHVVTTANEQLIMDTDDVKTATKVWRWNLNGLGYSKTGYNGTYEAAITMDGSIVGERLTAGSVAADKLSVAYKQSVEKSISDSATKATNAANENTANSLKSYYTKQETETVIQNSAQQILLAAQKNSENYVDNQLTNYTTSAQLTVATDSILLQVSEKYATQDSLGNYTKTSEIRSKFALDPSSVTIESGLVTFKSDTLVIDSTNFKLSKGGAVSATGKFRSEQNRTDGLVLYSVLEGRGFFNYSRLASDPEGSEVCCVNINTTKGEASGWVGIYDKGNLGVLLNVGAGRGVRIFNAANAERKVVFYANHDSAGNGSTGVLTSEGQLRFSASIDDKKNGMLRIWGNNNHQTFSFWSDNAGNPAFRMYNTSNQEQVSINGSSNGGNIWLGNGAGSSKVILQMIDGSRTGYFEKLGIGNGYPQDVKWVWSATLGGWLLTTSASLK